MNGRLRDEVRRRRSKLWDEHDLAARIERHDGAMRFSGRGQWQLCSDDRLDVPCRELLAQRLVDSAQLLLRGVRENQSALLVQEADGVRELSEAEVRSFLTRANRTRSGEAGR